MKTIEERATNYMNIYPNMDDPYYAYYVKDGYIQGASDEMERFIGKLKEVLDALMINTRDKFEIIKAMEE